MWNGTFGPALSKSIGETRYVSIWRMTANDWRVLDWPALRNAAKNNLVDFALKDRVVGFINFGFVQKGNQQDGYFLPVGESEVTDIESLSDPRNLRNTINDPSLSVSAGRVDSLVGQVADSISVYGIIVVTTLGAVIISYLNAEGLDEEKSEEVEEAKFELEIVVTDDLGEPLTTEAQEAYVAIQAMAADGFEDYAEADLALMLIMTLLHDYSIEVLENLANELEDSLGEAEDRGQI